ncbi:hypothetical protein AAMO2058_000632700 [Amorphochlora amoebiformis]
MGSRSWSSAVLFALSVHIGLIFNGCYTSAGVITSCSDFQTCRCTEEEACIFDAGSTHAFDNANLHCPASGDKCTFLCDRLEACREANLYVYGGQVDISCRKSQACKDMRIEANDSFTPAISLMCQDEEDASQTCSELDIDQVRSGGSLLLDIHCKESSEDPACPSIFLPSTNGFTFVRATGVLPEIFTGPSCPLGQWLCGSDTTCKIDCDQVNSTFHYYTGGSAAPTQTLSPLTSSPASDAPATLTPITLTPITLAPATVAPISVAPITVAPATIAPVTSDPTTLSPNTDSPATLSPATFSPSTFSPSTHSPSTHSPSTLSPSTLSPSTHSPSTHSPSTCSPLTLSPSTLSPSTLSPSTLSPSTSSPSTLSPSTHSPSTLSPSTHSPSTLSPSTLSPSTHSPSSLSPSSLSPSSLSPLSLSPSTLSPSTLSPSSLSPVSLSPGSQSPVSESPSSVSPSTWGPTTCTPATVSPATNIPSSYHPGTLIPSSTHPASQHPVTQGPVTYTPSSSHPASQHPTTQGPVTLFPSTLCPSSHPSTCHPVTLHPVTHAPDVTNAPVTTNPLTLTPTVSPVTIAPATVSPSLSIITVTVSRGHLSVTEDFPPWDSNTGYIPGSTDRFYIHNTEPAHVLDVNCDVDTQKISLFLERFGSDGSSQLIQANSVRIAGDDPTRWECIPSSPGRINLQCNGGITTLTDVPEPAECTLQALKSAGIIPYGYSCPTPCYLDSFPTGGCYGSGGLSSVGVFSVHGNYDDNSTRPTPFSVTCSINRVNSQQSSGFQLGGTLRNVIWPQLTDFLIEYRGSFLSSSSGGQMVITVSSATKIIAIGRKTGVNEPFEPGKCPNITVGGIKATNVTCSTDRVSFVTPAYRELCGQSQTCGHFPIQLRNPDIEGKAAGGVLQCPPGCPSPGLGVYYTPECTGYSTPSVCAIKALEGSQEGLECAWGARDDCQICYENGLCPGGYRLWPQKGYYAENERVREVTICPRPSAERCVGWNVEKGKTACGEGYYGILCGTCADGYYESLGECIACPEGGVNKKVEKLIYLLLVLVLLFGLIGSSTYIAYRNAPDEMQAVGLYQAKDFVLWSFLVLQIHGLVLRSASGLTPEVKALFSWLNIVNLDFEAVGPECFSTSAPLIVEMCIMAFAIAACLFLTLLGTQGVVDSMSYCLSFDSIATLRSLLFRFSTTIYTPVTYIAFSLVNCQTIAAGDGEARLVSSYNNNLTCYGPDHFKPATLAIISLMFCTFGYPIGTFILLHTTKNRLENNRGDSQNIEASKVWKMYSYFFGDDYYPRYFWALHVHFCVALVLIVTLVFSNEQNDASQWSKLWINVTVLCAEIVFLIVKDPHLPHVSWKKATKLSILVVVCLNSALDFTNYMHETDRVNRKVVVVLSNIVFVGALLNFVILFIAFCLIVLPTSSWKNRMKTHFLLQLNATTQSIHQNFDLRAKSLFRSRNFGAGRSPPSVSKPHYSQTKSMAVFTSMKQLPGRMTSKAQLETPRGSESKKRARFGEFKKNEQTRPRGSSFQPYESHHRIKTRCSSRSHPQPPLRCSAPILINAPKDFPGDESGTEAGGRYSSNSTLISPGEHKVGSMKRLPAKILPRHPYQKSQSVARTRLLPSVLSNSISSLSTSFPATPAASSHLLAARYRGVRGRGVSVGSEQKERDLEPSTSIQNIQLRSRGEGDSLSHYSASEAKEGEVSDRDATTMSTIPASFMVSAIASMQPIGDGVAVGVGSPGISGLRSPDGDTVRDGETSTRNEKQSDRSSSSEHKLDKTVDV